MLYLRSITLPDSETEFLSVASDKKKGVMTCYGSKYPFGMFPEMGLERIDFAPITVLCGGNGSGKSTLLNVITECLSLGRTAPYNRTPYFNDYTKLCRPVLEEDKLPPDSRIITSDDVFQSVLRRRAAHDAMDDRREELIREYFAERDRLGVRLSSLADYDAVKQHNDVHGRHYTPSHYVNDRLSRAEDAASNGESAFRFFTEAIRGDALYLLDEPENSLSPLLADRLAEFLSESVRFFGCQFVIATHSPILLALPGAKIYDLDARPVKEAAFWEIPSVRLMYRFFRAHDRYFEE